MPRLLKECKGVVQADVVGMASTAAHQQEGGGDEAERLVVAHGDGTVKVLAPWASEAEQTVAGEWQVKGLLSCMALSPRGSGGVAVGGQERELTLLDATTGQAKWEARNVAHDKLNLRQPVWVTAVHFLQEEDGSDEGGAGNVIAIGTAYKQVRLYDVRVENRRPVRAMELGEGAFRLTALCSGMGRQGHPQLVSGDAGGTVYHLDVGKMALLGRLEGPAGSVRGLARHPNAALPYMALAGLDRMARVYDLRRPRKEVFRFYLKQRLTAVLFAAQARMGPSKAQDAAEEARNVEPAGEDELAALHDDVGSLEEGDDSEEESEGDWGEEEHGEPRGGGKEGKKKEKGIRIQRICQSDDESAAEGGMEEDSSDRAEEEEDAGAFGRRNDPVHLELNIVGADSDAEEEEEDSEEEAVKPPPKPAPQPKRQRR